MKASWSPSVAFMVLTNMVSCFSTVALVRMIWFHSKAEGDIQGLRRNLQNSSTCSCTCFDVCCNINPVGTIFENGTEETSFLCRQEAGPDGTLAGLYEIELSDALVEEHFPGGRKRGYVFVCLVNAILTMDSELPIIQIGSFTNLGVSPQGNIQDLPTVYEAVPAGTKTALVVRISTPTEELKRSADSIRGFVFGEGPNRYRDSASSQFASCSGDKFRLTPATGPDIQNGILEFHLNQSVSGQNIHSLDRTLETQLDMVGLCSQYDHVLVGWPSGTTKRGGSWGGFQEDNTATQACKTTYNDNHLSYPSFVIHEIGHNYGRDHSGKDRGPECDDQVDFCDLSYGDRTDKMGWVPFPQVLEPFCFNGQKYWAFGWFDDRQVELEPSTMPWSGELIAFVNYKETLPGQIVLLKVGDMHLVYNRAVDFNSGVAEHRDEVTIALDVQNVGRNPHSSELVAGLAQGDNFVHDGTSIEVCNMDNGDISKASLLIKAASDLTSTCTNLQSTTSPQPSQTPTSHPSPNPTLIPTFDPTSSPSQNPTPIPTSNPTSQPSAEPTHPPTPEPTSQPSANPTFISPTPEPTIGPTPLPSQKATLDPTHDPILPPSNEPTSPPSPKPTHPPSLNPTPNPTPEPSSQPTSPPSQNPIPKPSPNPTLNPTPQPSMGPTPPPTPVLSVNPSSNPTPQPSTEPTPPPTTKPSLNPTSNPTPQPFATLTRSDLIDLILSESPHTSFENSNSPQSLALDWLSNDEFSSLELHENSQRLLHRFGLATLWYAMNGAEWRDYGKGIWLESTNECSWNSIQFQDCTPSGFVTSLSLNDLSGSIPRELGLLTRLTGFSAHSNPGLTGSLPSELGKLTALTALSLHYNGLTGSLPSEIGRMSALSFLLLRSNFLSGSLPTEFGQLAPSLRFVYIEGNNLVGSVPSSWCSRGGIKICIDCEEVMCGSCCFDGGSQDRCPNPTPDPTAEPTPTPTRSPRPSPEPTPPPSTGEPTALPSSKPTSFPTPNPTLPISIPTAASNEPSSTTFPSISPSISDLPSESEVPTPGDPNAPAPTHAPVPAVACPDQSTFFSMSDKELCDFGLSSSYGTGCRVYEKDKGSSSYTTNTVECSDDAMAETFCYLLDTPTNDPPVLCFGTNAQSVGRVAVYMRSTTAICCGY